MKRGISIADYTHSPAPTFWLPDDATRKSLVEGDTAKLVFEMSGSGMRNERMWVDIVEVISPGAYRGKLANRPLALPMQSGEIVEFQWKNVIDVIREKDLN